MAKMTDSDVGGRFARRRDDAVNFSTTEFATSRREALRFYRGEPLGNEVDGASSVVSRDVLEAIEAMTPGLLRPFVSGDETVRFEPQGPEDEDAAKQATEYVNWLFTSRCDAFSLMTTAMKDGLLQRLGAAKVVLEVDERSDEESYNGLSEEEYAILAEAQDVEFVGTPMQDETGAISCKVRRKSSTKRIVVYPVAPDELIFDRQLVSLDTATFVAHRARRPVFELIDMGLDRQKCMDLADGDDTLPLDGERQERFMDDGYIVAGNDDPLTREVWVTDGYIRMDVDGDGYPEWRHIVMAGAGSDLLLNETCDGHPFVAWTPIPLPHKFVGLSIYDIVRELQLIKTALWRETLDNLYLHNRPQREVVEGQVNIDDLLAPRVGGLIRVKAPGMIRDVQTPSIVGATMPMIEYTDTVREARTGSTRYNQGMDADSLNKTATGVTAIMGASQQRLELVARQFAEQFMKPMFRKMLELVCKNPDMASVVKLRGKWVPVDPRQWKTGYDMSIAVGLGTGDKSQIIGQLMQLLQMDQTIIAMQGGADGPIVTLPNVYEKLKRLAESMGLKGVENYYTEPPTAEDGQPKPPEGPSPERQAMEAQQAAEAAKAKADFDKSVADNSARVTIAREAAASAERIARQNNVVKLMLAGLNEAQAEAAVDEREQEPESEPVEPQEAPEMESAVMMPEMAMEAPVEAPDAAMMPFDGEEPPMMGDDGGMM